MALVDKGLIKVTGVVKIVLIDIIKSSVQSYQQQYLYISDQICYERRGEERRGVITLYYLIDQVL